MPNSTLHQSDWLELVRDSVLFYPCAGCDTKEPIEVFHSHIQDFRFYDRSYKNGPNLDLEVMSSLGYAPISSTRSTKTTQRDFNEGNKFESLEETYQRPDGRLISIQRKKALIRGHQVEWLMRDFSDSSIGVFIHRGDSLGEGGSNIWFLSSSEFGDKRRERNLFPTIAPKLKDRALIISDGTLSNIPWVKQHVHLKQAIDEPTLYGGRLAGWDCFRWELLGELSARSGPTYIWGVERY